MLSENEKQLQTVKLLARTSTLAVFDTPTLMVRNGMHLDYVTRHFVWIDSKTGKNAMLVWLLRPNSAGLLTLANEPLRWVPAGTKEDRAIHVDKDEFILGIPTERSFALENLPPGKSLTWPESAKVLAVQPNYDVESLKSLTMELNRALQSLKAAP